MNKFRFWLGTAIILFFAFFGYRWFQRTFHENKILMQMVARLEADSRVAEVLVTGVNYDEKTQKTLTTIKFLEYDSQRRALPAKYYTFAGNVIQFQSLVIRFDDLHVRGGDRFKGKSAYLFWKAFFLDGKNTQEFEINPIHEIPSGYKVPGLEDPLEERMWQSFWRYALDPAKAKGAGIKNAQIEAPGSMFIPGYLYTLKIEHDGGLRIDVSALSSILRGERIPR